MSLKQQGKIYKLNHQNNCCFTIAGHLYEPRSFVTQKKNSNIKTEAANENCKRNISICGCGVL